MHLLRDGTSVPACPSRNVNCDPLKYGANGSNDRNCCLGTRSSQAAGAVYTPYAGLPTMAKNTSLTCARTRRPDRPLIVYDDPPTTSRTYREISPFLLRAKSPGVKPYPGQYLYLHSRLLGAGLSHLSKTPWAGNLLLRAQNHRNPGTEIISAYVPTNLISITPPRANISLF